MPKRRRKFGACRDVLWQGASRNCVVSCREALRGCRAERVCDSLAFERIVYTLATSRPILHRPNRLAQTRLDCTASVTVWLSRVSQRLG